MYAWLLYDALLSVHQSARRVEAELAHPLVWGHLRKLIQARFPKKPEMWLPAEPIRRHHYLYGRTRHLTSPEVLERLALVHRSHAVADARRLGLLDPDGPGSFTHPDLSRMIYADGKVVTPLYRAQQATRVDTQTGEILPQRHESDAGLHFEGTGETAFGTKWVLTAVRTLDVNGRIILDVEWVPKPGGEAATAMNCFQRLAPLMPGAQGVIYDTALRGVHHQRLLRDLGLLPLNRVTAAKAGAKHPSRTNKRVEKSVHVEDRTITLPDGTARTIALFARGGAIGIGQLTDTGKQLFTPLRRTRTHRRADKGGTYRWYNEYALPHHLGAGTITIRLHGDDDDTKRKFNRTENIRPIPPGDPDFTRLFGRRNDAESINRALDDTLWLRRAHSVGHARQHLNLITHAAGVNALVVQLHQRAHGDPPAALAA
ncbi:MAG: hypothetical protein Q8K58_16255 [Acidimicrobiales bacterium]|nr:hypothetical protein [Acidimicrobiales bacterium]